MNGLCNFVFHFCLQPRKFKHDPLLSLFLCPIWKYEGLFMDTFISRHNIVSIEYAWSGSRIKIKPSDLPIKWITFSDIHERFSFRRRVFLLYITQLENVLALAVKRLSRTQMSGIIFWRKLKSNYVVVQMSLKARLTRRLVSTNIVWKSFFAWQGHRYMGAEPMLLLESNTL